LPDGQITWFAEFAHVQPCWQKYFCFSEIKSGVHPHSSCPTEGRWPTSSTRVGMRWTQAVLKTRAPTCGRRSRVVLMPRRRHQVLREDARDDGDKKARSPGRARRKPLKPLRAGMPGLTGELVVTTLVCFLLCTRGCGCIGARHSPRPLISGAEISCIARAHGAARMRRCVSRSMCVSPSLPATNAKRLRKGALATKQSIFRLADLQDGLLRFARNDG
jgi:hypothetical protein